MGLIKLLIIIICIYLVLKWIVKPLLKISFDRMIKTMVSKHMYEQSRQGNYERHYKKEGSINVDYIPEDYKKKGKTGPGVGEYVDYEEVK